MKRGEVNNVDPLNPLKGASQKDFSVLIVSDDRRFKEYFQHLAQASAMQMDVVEKPQDCILKIKNQHNNYHVLIIDFDLSDSNGLELAEYINLFVCDIPTILISGIIYFDITNGDLPPYIDHFVPKSLGAVHILKLAVSFHKKMCDRRYRKSV